MPAELMPDYLMQNGQLPDELILSGAVALAERARSAEPYRGAVAGMQAAGPVRGGHAALARRLHVA